MASSPSTEEESTHPTILEVEQKFAITPASSDSATATATTKSNLSLVQQNLKLLGFKQVKEQKFMDWYFDMDTPYWTLSINNNFLRFRQPHQSKDSDIITTSSANDAKDNGGYDPERGIWQLKRGYESDHVESKTTVYQEIEGDEAIHLALCLIHEKCNESIIAKLPQSSAALSSSSSSANLERMDGYIIPIIPSASKDSNDDSELFNQLSLKLVPFARIETIRSSWKWNGSSEKMENGIIAYKDLTVDLDGTDFGHMVGEIEAIVHNQDEIQDANMCIENLMHKIARRDDDDKDDDDPKNNNDKSPRARGKLETYMIMNRKKHYDACVKNGSM